MQPTLRIHRLDSAADPAFDALIRIYTQAHPESERKSIPALRGMIARREYTFLAALAGSVVVGFSISISLLDCDAALLEYLAVDATHRGQGIGCALFRETAREERLGDLHLLVEADSDKAPSADADERARRKAFYRRLGCREIEGLVYRMPRVSVYEPPSMDVLVYRNELPGWIEKPHLRGWLEAAYRQVYGRGGDDPAIGAMLDGLEDRIALR